MTGLLFPDFIELLSKYDIMCMSETNLTDYDIVDLQGCHYEGKTRNHMTLKRSGGIGIFIKDYLFKAAEIIEWTCNDIIWVYDFKCNVLIGLNEDILIGGYIFASCRL